METLTTFDLLFLARIENSQEKEFIRTEMKSGTIRAKSSPMGILLEIEPPTLLEDEANRRFTDKNSLKLYLKRKVKSFGYISFLSTGMYYK